MTMARQFPVSPHQVVLWARHELTDAYPAPKTRGTRRAVPLAYPSSWSMAVNHGHSAHRRPAPPQVRRLPGRGQDRRPTFQAGHAGSIPVTRSLWDRCARGERSPRRSPCFLGVQPPGPARGASPPDPHRWLRAPRVFAACSPGVVLLLTSSGWTSSRGGTTGLDYEAGGLSLCGVGHRDVLVNVRGFGRFVSRVAGSAGISGIRRFLMRGLWWKLLTTFGTVACRPHDVSLPKELGDCWTFRSDGGCEHVVWGGGRSGGVFRPGGGDLGRPAWGAAVSGVGTTIRPWNFLGGPCWLPGLPVCWGRPLPGGCVRTGVTSR